MTSDRPPSHHGRYDLHLAPLPKHNAPPTLRPCSTCVCLASREHACTLSLTRTLNTPLSHVRLRSHKHLARVLVCSRLSSGHCCVCHLQETVQGNARSTVRPGECISTTVPHLMKLLCVPSCSVFVVVSEHTMLEVLVCLFALHARNTDQWLTPSDLTSLTHLPTHTHTHTPHHIRASLQRTDGVATPASPVGAAVKKKVRCL